MSAVFVTHAYSTQDSVVTYITAGNERASESRDDVGSWSTYRRARGHNSGVGEYLPLAEAQSEFRSYFDDVARWPPSTVNLGVLHTQWVIQLPDPVAFTLLIYGRPME